MIKSIALRNFTVFRDALVEFTPGINVIVGENGMGKSHLLKLGYACASVSSDWERSRSESPQPTKTDLQKSLADKLRNVFRPDSLGRLARRGSGRQRADVQIEFIANRKAALDFSFATNSKTEVALNSVPLTGVKARALFFPTKEVISMFPKFASLYRDYHIEMDETYYDLCLALERPLLKGRRYDAVQTLVDRLEHAIGGTINNVNGRFVLSIPGEGNMEIPLVAEGIRKLATVAYLIANGSLRDKATLFWDEPETNLNPKLISALVEILLLVAQQGVQIILATHSLFMLKELELQLKGVRIQANFIALSEDVASGGIKIDSGSSIESIEPIAALDAELALADRFDSADFDDSEL